MPRNIIINDNTVTWIPYSDGNILDSFSIENDKGKQKKKHNKK